VNLIELNQLIDSIPPEETEMIAFYKKKRTELIAEINDDLAAKGLALGDKFKKPNKNDLPVDTPNSEYPPCLGCGGNNDIGELCPDCAKDNNYFGSDDDLSGSWMARDCR